MRWGAVVLIWFAWAGSAAASPLDLACDDPADGRVYCAGSVPSFDDTPLAVDLTSPVEAGEAPLVVMRHGYSGGRFGPDNPEVHWYADHGYRVLTYTARGHGGSGGTAHWADPRYEPRDTQHLAGRLVDKGLVDPDGIAVTGVSYGGGQAATLAALDDRVMLEDGTLVPWTSPEGVPLHLAAAVPFVGWTDLAEALAPDGRELDYAEVPATRPAGIPVAAWNDLLDGWPGIAVDPPTHDLFHAWSTGEPTAALALAARTRHSAIALYDEHPPAPTLFLQGWDDELFSVREATRAYDHYRATGAPVRIAVADWGHGRAQSKADDYAWLRDEQRAWIDHYARGTGAAPAQGLAYRTMTCPAAAPSGPPRVLPGPLETPGEVRVGGGSGSFDGQGGDQEAPYNLLVWAPFCDRQPTTDDGVELRGAPARGDGYTLTGAPTVSGDFAVSGSEAQVNARLYDETDAGHVLVARGAWRPVAGHGVFQLHAGGWHFAPGHRPVLELLGADRGYVREAELPFRVAVDRLELRLPVAESPGAAEGDVTVPRPYDVPAGYRLTPTAAAREAALPSPPPPGPTPTPAPLATAAPSPEPTPAPTATPAPAIATLRVERLPGTRTRRQPYVLRLKSDAAVAGVRFDGPGVSVTDRSAPFRARVRIPRGRRLRRIRFRAGVVFADGHPAFVSRRARLPARRR